MSPTLEPTTGPTLYPTDAPSRNPTDQPTLAPTPAPSFLPTSSPTPGSCPTNSYLFCNGNDSTMQGESPATNAIDDTPGIIVTGTTSDYKNVVNFHKGAPEMLWMFVASEGQQIVMN